MSPQHAPGVVETTAVSNQIIENAGAAAQHAVGDEETALLLEQLRLSLGNSTQLDESLSQLLGLLA